MMSGSPPTERKARTGLFTPPTRTFSARSKISRERWRLRFKVDWVALIFVPSKLSRLQPVCDVLGVIGQDDVGAGALDAGENFEYDALLIDPAFLRGGLDHRIFAADV